MHRECAALGVGTWYYSTAPAQYTPQNGSTPASCVRDPPDADTTTAYVSERR
jgi:hypothetical protein